MKIVIDYDKCIGIGSCEALVPEVFEVGESGQVQVLVDSPGGELAAQVDEAVAGCPTGAISIDS